MRVFQSFLRLRQRRLQMPQTLRDPDSRVQCITSAARDETPGEDMGNSHGTFGSSFSPLDLAEISSSAALTRCQAASLKSPPLLSAAERQVVWSRLVFL